MVDAWCADLAPGALEEVPKVVVVPGGAPRQVGPRTLRPPVVGDAHDAGSTATSRAIALGAVEPFVRRTPGSPPVTVRPSSVVRGRTAPPT